jgi:hypothetical protein
MTSSREEVTDMRIIWTLVGAVLLMSLMFGCGPGSSGPIPSDNGNGNGSAFSDIKLNITGPIDESVVRSNPVSVTGSTEPGADVMINGLSITAEDGHFSAMVELEPGPNVIDISAKISPGKQTSKYLTIVYVP